VTQRSSGRWSDLAARRWAWAESAVERFKSEVDPSRQRYFDIREREFTAVLFGPTQVGKTTLLLHMLGVAPQFHTHMSEVLRAGRERGRSSTSAPSRYRWKPGDNWSLRFGTGAAVSLREDDLLSELATLRDEAGDPSGPLPVVEIGIPEPYRGEVGVASNPVILDLPGIGAESEAERDLAASLARTYIPTAHVVVIVLKAEKVTVLDHAQALPSLQLQQWVYAPERFRLVLTHTFSAQSTRDELGHGSTPIDHEELLDFIVHEGIASLDSYGRAIERTPSLAGRIRRSLFPIEYGDSWADLATSSPDYHALAQPARDYFVDLLTSSLREVVTADARYTALARASETVQLAAIDQIAHHEAQLAEARLELERVLATREQVATALSSLEADQKWLDEIDHRLSALTTGPPRLPRRLNGCAGAPESAFDDRADALNALESLSEDFRSSYLSAWKSWVSRAEMQWLLKKLRLPAPTIRNKADSVLLDRVDCCGKCTSSGFKQFVFDLSPPEECYRKQYNGSVDAYRKLNKTLERKAIDALNEIRSQGKVREARKRVRKNASLSASLARVTDEQSAAEAKVAATEEFGRALEASVRADLKNAESLQAMFRAQITRDLNSLSRRSATANPQSRIEATLLSVLTLKAWFQMKEASR
jgi:hypothetical protein